MLRLINRSIDKLRLVFQHMTLQAFIGQAKLNWSEIQFSHEGGGGYACPFDLSPADFITFAKADLYSTETRSLINALTNAKRAIDCQVDSLLTGLGFDPDKLDKQLGSQGMSFLKTARSQRSVPLKFCLVETLGVATPAIVAKMRQLRNSLEHDYRKPKKSEVRTAIDIAELFVQSCGGRMRSAPDGFSFGSGETRHRGCLETDKLFNVHYEEGPVPNFNIVYWQRSAFPVRKTKKGIVALPLLKSSSPELVVSSKDDGFIPLLKLMWSTEWDARDLKRPMETFLREVGVKFPRSRLRVDRDRKM